MIRLSLQLKGDTTKWTLIYSNVTEDDIRAFLPPFPFV
jgi:hypothetical protein